MVDLSINEVRKQIEILKIAHDEGFYCDSLNNEDLGDDEDYIYPLAATNYSLLENLFSGFCVGNLEDDYEELEVYHEFLETALDSSYVYDKEEITYYLLSDPLLDKYFSLVEKIKALLSEKEFVSFRNGSISSLGVIMDYAQAIERDTEAFDTYFFLEGDSLYWMLLFDQEFDLITDTDVPRWSHSMLKLIKEKIPLIEKFLEEKNHKNV